MCFSAANKPQKKDFKKLQEDFAAQYEEYDKDVRPTLFCVSGFDHPDMPVITACLRERLRSPRHARDYGRETNH